MATIPVPKKPSFLQQSPMLRERRDRTRLKSTAPGWLIKEEGDAQQLREVTITDVSRTGVGFISPIFLDEQKVHMIRIGLGPMRLARTIRIIRCEQQFETGEFACGAEFV